MGPLKGDPNVGDFSLANRNRKILAAGMKLELARKPDYVTKDEHLQNYRYSVSWFLRTAPTALPWNKARNILR
ncbi:MAG: hypothetical protein M1840_004538 [Geoglossum simile]|nr:MAG: hypothetical protein M1840_004538 [Geoglossum simile]